MATKFDKYAFEAKGEESIAISAAGDDNQSRRQVAKLINVLSAYTGVAAIRSASPSRRGRKKSSTA